MQKHAERQDTVPNEPEQAQSSPSTSEGSPSPSDGHPNEAGAKVPVRDFRGRGWYRIENELLDPEHFPELDPYDIAVYNALAYHVNTEEDGCFPSLQTIADYAHCSRKKAWECIEKMVDLDLIRKTKQTTSGGLDTSSEYHLLSVKDAVDDGKPDSDQGCTAYTPGVHDVHTRDVRHTHKQDPSNKTQQTKSSTTTSAGAGENVDEAEDNPGLTDTLKSHFDWLERVGDEDKRQAVHRVADRLLTDHPSSELESATVREVCIYVIESAYGRGALSQMSDLQRESVLDTLTDLYEQGQWSEGNEWTEPVAAVAVARFRDLDLSRVGGIVKGWTGQASTSQTTKSNELINDYERTNAGGDSSREGKPSPPGTDPSADWETNGQGYPADLQATKQWAEAHNFNELLAKGLWVACGQYGWTDVVTRTPGRVGSSGEPIQDLEAYANGYETRLKAIANENKRTSGRPTPEMVTAEEAGVDGQLPGDE